MKNVKASIAILIGIVTLMSCDTSTKSQRNSNPMIGQWKVDSLSSKDSNNFGALLWAMSLKDRDSTQYDLEFSEDTVSFHQKDTVTKTSYQYNGVKKEVVFSDDSSVYKLHSLNEKRLTLTSTDSVVLFLKKK